MSDSCRIKPHSGIGFAAKEPVRNIDAFHLVDDSLVFEGIRQKNFAFKEILIAFLCLLLIQQERNDLLWFIYAGDVAGHYDRIAAIRTAAGCRIPIRHDRAAAGLAGIDNDIVIFPFFTADSIVISLIKNFRIKRSVAIWTFQFLCLGVEL